ncbi:MAG: hypothetical protein GEU28_03550 [Dehalococcoidia bacterium]|nr:hypothetical protein [Dehalococcoidia bacterium]
MRILDLTVTIGPGTLSPPSVNQQLTITPAFRGPGYWRGSTVAMTLHSGSHVDFMAHHAADGEVASDVDLERLCGPALVLDMRDVEADQPITLALVQERGAGVRPGDIALIHTGWTDRMWGKFPDYYQHSPYCEPEAARWLVDRGAKAVGFDCFSEYSARLPDFTSEDFVVHKAILENGALLMQHLTNLSELPLGRRVQFFGPCVKISDAEGSPARFFALVED